MRKQILTALTAAVLIFTALPSMANDRGERKNQSHATTTQYRYTPPYTSVRQARTRNLLKPILSFICSAGDCRLKVRGQHKRRHPGYFTQQNHRRDISRHGNFGRQHRYFRSWRKHLAWQKRNDRKYRRHDRRVRRHFING